MFIIKPTQDKTINWPCVVEVAADGGKISKFEFTGIFRLLNDDQKEALKAEADKGEADKGNGAVGTDGEADSDVNWKELSVDNILRTMEGWKGVVDESKSPIEFNRDNLLAAARSVNGISILRAINTAIAEISTGARIKN
jgi:hypothetical protein